MPTKRLPQFTAWSYSRWHDYETCPLKAKLKYLDKITEPPNDAMARGTEMHTAAQEFVEGKHGLKLPKPLVLFTEEFKGLYQIRRKVECEVQLAFDANWNPVEWFAKNAWCRMVIDATHPVNPTTQRNIDYKSGKVRDENQVQLPLYAAGSFITKPKVKTVNNQYWYLDQGEIREQTFKRAELPLIQKDWTRRTRAMMSDVAFVATPNFTCRYCYYAKDKTGHCPHRG